MSARGDSYSVQVLRSPSEPRPQALRVVELGLDAATAPPLATPAIHLPLGIYSLPPSPPYTNPHLRRAIPLPLLDEMASKHNSSDSINTEKDGERRMLFGLHGPSNLLSPPYSAQRRSLSLLTVDEKEEELTPPSSAGVSTIGSDGYRWGESDDVFDQSKPPMLKLKDLDLGEESDDWDEPLFLNAPSALSASDSLSLNLFGAVYTSDNEGPASQSFGPPSSPTIRSSSLPDFDEELVAKCDPLGESRPLFDPSDFDVFENGWDTINSIDSTQASPFSHESSQDSIVSSVYDSSTELNDPVESSFTAPSSPSRRSIINLPDDDDPELSQTVSLELSQELSVEDEGIISEVGQDFGYPRSSQNAFQLSQRHQPFDVPSEVYQTPFNIALVLPARATRIPPADSLLFAAPEPHEIPLPDSPESPTLSFQSEYVVPPLRLEESRIRRLHQELAAIEADARTREALLTEYIGKLNTLKPPSPTVPIPVYFPKAQSEGDLDSSKNENELESLHIDKQHSSGLPTTSHYDFSNHATATLQFLQTRRREVQNAIALRATERRRRKITKERIRELEALLTLKACQLRPHSADASRNSVTPSRGRKGRNDEAIVIAASGSDRHLGRASTNGDGIMQLVAKMVFRRRDTSKPLSGRASSIVRGYVPSGLSRMTYFDETINEDDTNDTAVS